jgi:hypothetical protein
MFSPFAKTKFREKLVAWFVALLFLDALVNLLTVHGDFLGSIDANAHLITFHAQHGNGDIVTYHQGLSDPASQNQHSFLLTDSITGQQSAINKNGGSPADIKRRLHPSIDQPGQKESSRRASQKSERRG